MSRHAWLCAGTFTTVHSAAEIHLSSLALSEGTVETSRQQVQALLTNMARLHLGVSFSASLPFDPKWQNDGAGSAERRGDAMQIPRGGGIYLP